MMRENLHSVLLCRLWPVFMKRSIDQEKDLCRK